MVLSSPSLPPQPPSISVERRAVPASYRENGSGDELVIRWRPPATHGTTWVLGVLAGLIVISALGGVLIDYVFWWFAVGLCALTGLAVLDVMLSVGEVRIGSDALRSSRGRGARALDVPRHAVHDLRTVDVGVDPPSREIWARLDDETERAVVRGLPDQEASAFILALLRSELRLSS